MEYQKPYIRRSQSNDQHSSHGGSRGEDGRPARGRGLNGESSSGWNHSLDQGYMHGTDRKTRSVEEDWFEERMAQQTQMKLPKGPTTRKAGWNQWVSPTLRDTKPNVAPMTDAGGQSGLDPTSPTIADDIRGRSPPINPGRSSFTKVQSFNGGSQVSHERNTYSDPDPPPLLQGNDIPMTEWSGDHALTADGRSFSDTQDPRHPLLHRNSPTTNPQTLPRHNSGPPPVPSALNTRRASPHSDTGLDPRKHSLSERERNHGQYSMPRVPTAPVLRTPSQSNPTPPPPPTMSKRPDATVQMERLSALLGDFMDHVSSRASIQMQRDYAKKHMAIQEAEFIKWRKQHMAFPPLAERKERDRANAQKEFDDVDKKLKQHVKSSDQLAKAIAMSVLAAPNEGKGDSARSHFLEDELETIRSEIRRLRDELKQVSIDYGRVDATQWDSTKSQNRITDMEFKLKNIQAVLAKPPVASTAENSVIQFEKQLVKFQDKLSRLQNRADDIPTLKLDLSKSKQEVRDLNSSMNVQVNGLQELQSTINSQVDSIQELRSKVNSQVNCLQELGSTVNSQVEGLEELKSKVNSQVDGLEELKSTVKSQVDGLRKLEITETELRTTLVSLNGTVIGEGDDKGLIDVIASVEEKLEKHGAAMTRMYEELNGFQDELQTFRGRIATIERGTSRRQTSQPTTTMTKYDDSEVRSELEAVKEGVTELQTELAIFRREQEGKDELVAADIDELNQRVQANRTEVEATISRVEASISTLQARPATPVTVSDPPPPVAPASGTVLLNEAASKKIQTTLTQLRQAVDLHQNNMRAHERAIQHLDDRFNNLTTDQLARNMVHQMSQMYPYAANVQAQLENVIKQDEHLQHNFANLYTRVVQLNNIVSRTHSSTSPEQLSVLPKRLDSLSEEVKSLQTHAKTEHEAITNRIDRIDLKLQTETPQLRENISSLREEVGALSAHIDSWGNRTLSDLGSVGIQVERLNEHCGLTFEPQAGSSHTATMQQKLAVQHKSATSAASDEGVAGTPSAAATTAGPFITDVETDDEDVLPAERRTERTKKRMRVEDSEEDEPINSR